MQLTVKEVSGLLNISEKTVYRWIDERKLPGYRLSGQYRFNRAELLEWATANRINVSPRIFEEPENGSTPLPELSDALEVGGIFYRLAGRNKPTVLRSVVQTLDFLLQMLLQFTLVFHLFSIGTLERVNLSELEHAEELVHHGIFNRFPGKVLAVRLGIL